jgi:hypothetical protein
MENHQMDAYLQENPCTYHVASGAEHSGDTTSSRTRESRSDMLGLFHSSSDNGKHERQLLSNKPRLPTEQQISLPFSAFSTFLFFADTLSFYGITTILSLFNDSLSTNDALELPAVALRFLLFF